MIFPVFKSLLEVERTHFGFFSEGLEEDRKTPNSSINTMRGSMDILPRNKFLPHSNSVQAFVELSRLGVHSSYSFQSLGLGQKGILGGTWNLLLIPNLCHLNPSITCSPHDHEIEVPNGGTSLIDGWIQDGSFRRFVVLKSNSLVVL
jgi:hypothetical protein